MILLLAEMLVVGCVVLGLYALKARLGLSLLFIFVASNQFLQHLLAVTVHVDVLGGFPVSPGSAVLFSSGLFALLVIYINEDIPTARHLIYGLLLANVTLAAIVALNRWALSTGRLQGHTPFTEWMMEFDPPSFFAGTILLLVDLLVLLVAYEFLRSKVRWMPQWGRIVLSLCLALTLDALVFVQLILGGGYGSGELLIGNLMGKLAAALVYGTLLWASLKLLPAGQPEATREPRDPLSILTYRERYQRLEAEKQELERTHEKERRRMQVAVEGAQLGLWEWEVKSGKVRYNQRAAEMFGLDCQEALTRLEQWEQRTHPDDLPWVRRVMRSHLKGRTSFFEVEVRGRTEESSWKWILNIGKVLERDEDGKAIRMSGAFLDIDRRKRAELALKESEQRYEQATAAAGVGVWDWNLKADEIFVDPRLKALLGYEDDEISDRLDDWGDRVHPSDADDVMAEATAHLEGRTPHYQIEHRMLHKDGSIRWFLAQGAAVRGSDGEPLRMVGTDTDITERKLAEQRLEELQQRYRDLFEGAPIMYMTAVYRDGDPVVEDCNSAFLDKLGYQREEVMGRSLADFYSQDSRRDLFGEDAPEVSEAGGELACERQLMTSTGETIYTLLKAQPELDSSGVVVGTRAMYVDISERKQAEEALKRSERKLAEAQRVSRIGSWELDLSTDTLDWSPESYAILGVDPRSFTPTAEEFLARVHQDDREIVRQLGRALPGKEPTSQEFRVVRADGQVRTVHTESRLATDEDGNRLRVFGTIQDITERKAIENEIRRSREQLRRLAARLETARETERASIAREIHDELGQALTGLKMDLTTLGPALSGQDAAARLKGMMALIDRTIESVRDLSSRLRPAVLDDLGLCEAIEWQAADFARRSGLECNLEVEADCRGLDRAIALGIFRILQEALTNVVRHAAASSVEISLHRTAAEMTLQVKDDGVGIESAILEAGDSLGLLGMRERAAGLGGLVTVRPAGEKGTLVSVSVPL